MAAKSAPVTRSTAAARRHLSRHVAGRGIEIGPGHVPFPVPFFGVEVRYVDRWKPGENHDLFPELGDDASFPDPDIVCNLDTEQLSPIDDASQDFVIASHTLEHVANPLWILAELHRVLRPGGVLVLLLPDRHLTFDRDREPTPLHHLVDEYRAKVTEVDDVHVAEFLEKVGVEIPSGDAARAELFELHRRRSIHVHVWDAPEFFSVLLYATREMGQQWEMVDAVVADDEGEAGVDFGWVLRRSTRECSKSDRTSLLDGAWRLWLEQRAMWKAEGAAMEAAQAELVGRVERLEARVDGLPAPNGAAEGSDLSTWIGKARATARTLRASGKGRQP